MTIDEKREALFGYCGLRYCNEPEDGSTLCPFANNEFCNTYWIGDAPESIIEEWYELFFGKDSTKNQTPVIQDSGERRQFDTGAVRDIQEGKGRCDLMPLDTVGVLMNEGLFYCLAMFQKHGDPLSLEESLNIFREVRQWDKATMFLEVAKHFEDGAKKYGENNWQKGIPVRCYIDSAVRHYLKWLRGDKDEPHDRAFCWNILCAIWTCKHKPELNDYNKEETEE